jgi:hypothetical protein
LAVLKELKVRVRWLRAVAEVMSQVKRSLPVISLSSQAVADPTCV